MSRTLAFGDDGSAGADICWRWIDSHVWDGWRLEVVTTDPPPGMTPVEPEESTLHPWQPDSPRVPSRDGFVGVEHLRADIDPRLALISKPWDLVAVGPRGSSLLKRLHLGSTADWLLREPSSPLVIARRPDPVEDAVFAADGSIHARRSLETLASIPWIDQVRVQVVSVDDGQTDVDEVSSAAAEVLRSAGAEVDTVTLKGPPNRAIVGLIDDTRPDLAAMGARGVKGIKRLVLGSTTAAVAAETDCTLLVSHASDAND